MFENTGRGFKDVSAQSGAVFAKTFPARGMAVGDYDNDGDLDVLVSNNGEAPAAAAQRGREPQQLARAPTRRRRRATRPRSALSSLGRRAA